MATEIEATITGFNKSMRKFATAWSRALAPAMLALKTAYLAAAEAAYQEEHGTLPGSIRTARLRKKRRDTVLRWFNRELASGRGARDLTHRSTTGET